MNTRNYNNDEENFSPRRKGRIRLVEILFLFFILLSTFHGSWTLFDWIEDMQRLPLLKVVVIGKQRCTNNDDILQSILSLGPPDIAIMQNNSILQNKIKGLLPWIKQVNVRKQWPNELEIHLVEYIPIASWNDRHMVDMDGNLFSAPSKYINQKDLPKLYGPEGSNNEVLQSFYEINQVLAKNRFMLKDITMTARRSWQLTLNNGIKLNLGHSDMMKRLSCFIELYPVLQQQELISDKRISYVDLRYNSGGAAIGWKPLFPFEKSN